MEPTQQSTPNHGTWSLGTPSPGAPSPVAARSWRRWGKRAFLGLTGLGLAAFIVLAAIPKPVSVHVAAVERRAMRVTVDEAGRARVRDRYLVSAPFAGSLGRVTLRAGDEVREGAVLASLVPVEPPLLDPRARAAAEARVASARAAHRQAEAATRRAEIAREDALRSLGQSKALAASGAVSADALARSRVDVELREEDVASARFAAQVAASEITAARAGLGLLDPRARRTEAYDVHAPVSGRVLKVVRADAGAVAAGTPLLEIGDPSALEVAVDVLTADAVRIAPGAPATLGAWGGGPLPAHVRRIEPSAFTRLSALGVEEQRVSVLLDVDAAPADWQALGDGWRVEASIVVWHAESAIVAPAGSVFRRGDDWAAYVVRDGCAALRTVRIGERSGIEVEILEGLSPGDRTIVHPGEQVAEGVRVTTL